MRYIAAIDIGSNALRLAVARHWDDQFHICLRDREAVRLGSDVFSEGGITPATYQALCQAIAKFENHLENFNVQKYRAIATSALREAENGQEIVKQIKQDTNIHVELISGDEEARLVFEAIALKVDFSQSSHLLIDIGGGSIELIAVSAGKIVKKDSFPIGTVRLLAMHKEHRNQDLDAWLVPHMREMLKDYFSDLPAFDFCVGTGGNMDRFAKIKEILTNRSAAEVSFLEIGQMKTDLEALTFHERMRKYQLRADRADVIIPAIVATETIMKMAGAKGIKLPQVGLKEGLLYELSSSR